MSDAEETQAARQRQREVVSNAVTIRDNYLYIHHFGSNSKEGSLKGRAKTHEDVI